MSEKNRVPFRRASSQPVAEQPAAVAVQQGKSKKSHKGLKIFGCLVLLLVVAYVAVVLWPSPANFSGVNPMRKTGELPLLIAHGGGNREFPDNTLEAFYHAYSIDPEAMMETDVSITADGYVILSHDTRLDRKTDQTGYISDWNYTDLMEQRVNFGYTNRTEKQVLVEGSERVRFTNDAGVVVKPTDVTYPEGVEPRHEEIFLATTLEQLLDAFPENRINVEIKQEGEEGLRCLEAVLEIVAEKNAWDRVVLASFHNEIYAEYQRLQAKNEVPSSFMCSPGLGNAALFYVLQAAKLDSLFGEDVCVLQLPTSYDLKFAGIELTINLATEALIEAAHEHNMAVHYWTINEEAEMRELIALGADGIMTDYPTLLAEVYASYTAE